MLFLKNKNTTAMVLLLCCALTMTFAQTDDDCPAPFSVETDMMCGMDMAPVLCDSGRCEYSNECHGKSAGYDSCCLICPSPTWGPDETPCDPPANPDDEVYCQRECEPGVTVECAYPSVCFAEAAGLEPFTCATTNTVEGPSEGKNEDECPLVGSADSSIMCTEQVEPVLCNDGECEYSNECAATTAGYDSGACCLKCPSPTFAADDPVCDVPADADKVTCERECSPGVLVTCEYVSECFAAAAGLDKADCTLVSSTVTDGDECPKPSGDKVCPAINKPVMCDDKCEYFNECLAIESGYDAEACILVTTEVGDGDGDNDNACPAAGSSDSSIICTEREAPVLCNEGACEYSNDCIATTAGFTTNSCCLMCPEPTFGAGDVICDAPEDQDKVKCKRDCQPGLPVECEYESLCLAQAAGLDETDCKPMNDSPSQGQNTDDCPAAGSVDSSTICTSQEAPVLCNDGACQYSNDCVATTAGFTTNDCCLKCPIPEFGAEDVSCDAAEEQDKVKCGRDCQPGLPVECEYESLCFAQAAGLDETDCELLNDSTFQGQSNGGTEDECPAAGSVDSSIMCTTQEAPVLCNDGACEYSNDCVATTAGFTTNSCCLKCPAPTFGAEDPTCDPTTGAPVTCERECQPGLTVECEYPNLCMAQAAGLTEQDCSVTVTETDSPTQSPVSKPPTTTTTSDDTCPEAASINPDTLCAEEFSPVLCDAGLCEYSNECVASTAGFASDECCVKCPNPFWEADETVCEMVEEPVLCQRECEPGVPVECSYLNLCYAEAAGVNADDCVADNLGGFGAAGEAASGEISPPSASPSAATTTSNLPPISLTDTSSAAYPTMFGVLAVAMLLSAFLSS